MENLKTIDGHTYRQDLLGDGWVIDAGCRGWNFTNELKKTNLVCAIDIENFDKTPEGVLFFHGALWYKNDMRNAYFFGNGTGNFIEGINGVPGNTEDRPCETKLVPCISLNEIYNEIGTDIDLLKLDIEGSEYEVMKSMLPIPRQITVEFHEHCHNDMHKRYINDILQRLSEWYFIIQNIGDGQWPQYRFLDTLFIRKDLI